MGLSARGNDQAPCSVGGDMTTHELAQRLLDGPDMPVALSVMGDVYFSDREDKSQSAIKVGPLNHCSGEYIVIGDCLAETDDGLCPRCHSKNTVLGNYGTPLECIDCGWDCVSENPCEKCGRPAVGVVNDRYYCREHDYIAKHEMREFCKTLLTEHSKSV